METLLTKRLILRRPTISDLNDFYEFAKLNDVGPNAGWLPHQSIEESKVVLKHHIKKGDIWFIVLKDNLKMIGTISIDYIDNLEAEVGYSINSNYWNLGYASEAFERVVEYSFTKLKLQKILCSSYSFNVSSQKIIKKNGFKFISINKKQSDNIEMLDDIYIYELTLEDFRRNLNANKI